MNDPDKYDTFSEFQRKDARDLIPSIVSAMNWKAGEKANTILDFGCGSGFNTKNVLLPLLAEKADNNKNPMQIYAIDVSKPMIDFASQAYQHPNLTYMVADVLKDDCEFPCQFEKIFSFHVLHWIPDQEKALQRLAGLLNSGGEIGLYYLSNASVYGVYDALSKDPVWESYHVDAKKFIPKSYYSPDPAKDLQDVMKNIGFEVLESKNITRQFRFESMDSLVENSLAANPFLRGIPSEKHDEYKQALKNNFTPMVNYIQSVDNSSAIEAKYMLVLIRGRKI